MNRISLSSAWIDSEFGMEVTNEAWPSSGPICLQQIEGQVVMLGIHLSHHR